VVTNLLIGKLQAIALFVNLMSMNSHKMSDPYAMLDLSTTTKGQKMTNELLAQIILDRYTPFAFSCACGGKDWDCEQATNDPYLNGVMDTLRRVTEYIRNFEETN
jgi:hypothetical protein